MHATHNQGTAVPAPTRRFDGEPETPAETLAGILCDPARFGANIAAQLATVTSPAEPDRAEGDYVVTDAGLKVLADAATGEAPGTAARVLRSAALYLQRYGWIQGAYYDATAQVFTPAACLVGAIGMVCYGGPVDAPAQHFDDPGFLDFEEAVLHLDRYLLVEDGSESYDFNDAKGRRIEDVVRVLRDAASRPADELIDAVRAIDAKNADMAVLVDLLKPRGIWGEQTVSQSSDVDNHAEGNLVDCLLCGAPGGYPYCQGSFGGRMSCADVVAADNAERTAQDGDDR